MTSIFTIISRWLQTISVFIHTIETCISCKLPSRVSVDDSGTRIICCLKNSRWTRRFIFFVRTRQYSFWILMRSNDTVHACKTVQRFIAKRNRKRFAAYRILSASSSRSYVNGCSTRKFFTIEWKKRKNKTFHKRTGKRKKT